MIANDKSPSTVARNDANSASATVIPGVTGYKANNVQNKQVSTVADKPARRAASQQTRCKQRWTFSVINVRPNQVDNA